MVLRIIFPEWLSRIQNEFSRFYFNDKHKFYPSILLGLGLWLNSYVHER